MDANNHQCFENPQVPIAYFTELEQRLLWTAFTLSFYGFLHASECLSLTWSDILLHTDHISITLRQSKTDPFCRGQSINIYATSTTTCPVQALRKYSDMVSITQPE